MLSIFAIPAWEQKGTHSRPSFAHKCRDLESSKRRTCALADRSEGLRLQRRPLISMDGARLESRDHARLDPLERRRSLALEAVQFGRHLRGLGQKIGRASCRERV